MWKQTPLLALCLSIIVSFPFGANALHAPETSASASTSDTSSTNQSGERQSKPSSESAVSPVVTSKPGDFALTFTFGGLGNMNVGGTNSAKVGNMMFSELGARAVLKSVIIPFSLGVGITNNLPDAGDSRTDFGLSASVGILKQFRVWRRIAPYFGGMFHLHYLDPSTPPNAPNTDYQVQIALGPVLGVEYFIADRVSLYMQGQLLLGLSFTDAVIETQFLTNLLAGGQLGLAVYF